MHEALYRRLGEVARSGSVTTYQEVAVLVGLDPREPGQRSVLSRLLREVSLHEHEHGRPLLSAVVVSRDTRLPGSGFFALMRLLGFGDAEDEALFARELGNVHEHWAASGESFAARPESQHLA